MASRAQPSRANPSGSGDIRRNLFNAQASRRPVGAAPASSKSSVFGAPVASEDSEDIVVRDKNGECAVAIPALPAPDLEQALDEETKSAEEKLQDLLANRPRQQASDQEILEALNTSLQNTVDSLSEDAWQFCKSCGGS